MIYGEDLARIHDDGFGEFARGAATHVAARLRAAGFAGGLVVELACGSGISSRVLTEAGYDVLGIDISAAMIDLARRNAPAASFVVASAYGAAIPSCVAVTAIGEGLGYLPADSDRLELAALARRVHEALAPGALFVFDLILHADEASHRSSSRSGNGWQLEVEIEDDPASSLLTRTIVVTRIADGQPRISRERHRVRTFDKDEVASLLRACGFHVETPGSYGAAALLPRRAAFVATKRALTLRLRPSQAPRSRFPSAPHLP